MSGGLFIAARSGDTARLRELLSRPDASFSPAEADEAGRTAIFYAQLAGHAEATALLTRHGWSPMERTNTFDGPGGRLMFWSDPSGVRVRQLRPPREPAPMVNWGAPSPHAVAQAGHDEREAAAAARAAGQPPAPQLTKELPKSRKKETVAFRKALRKAEYHRGGNTSSGGPDHPFYARKRPGIGKACAKPGLRRVRDEVEEEQEDEAELEQWEEAEADRHPGQRDEAHGEAPAAVPIPVSRTGVSGALASVQVSGPSFPAVGGQEGQRMMCGDEQWVVVPPPAQRRSSSRSSSGGESWLDVDGDGAGAAGVQLPAFDGERGGRGIML